MTMNNYESNIEYSMMSFYCPCVNYECVRITRKSVVCYICVRIDKICLYALCSISKIFNTVEPFLSESLLFEYSNIQAF